MKNEFTEFKTSDYINTEEEVVMFLNEALKENDILHFFHCVGEVARTEGMTKIASKTGISRDGLYKALSKNGNPTLDTIVKVLNSLNIELSLQKKSA